MSFKSFKTPFVVYNNPLPNPSPVEDSPGNSPILVSRPLIISAIALTTEKISSVTTVVPGSNATIEATKHKDTSSFHQKLFKKGINVLRPEVLLSNEFSPIATGRRVEENQNSISVQYGNNTFVEVTNTARLLELHQVLKENAIKSSEALIKRYGKIAYGIGDVIAKMRTTMSAHADDIYDQSVTKMRQNIIDRVVENSNNIVRTQIDQLSADAITLITDYIINDFIAKELIKYTGQIFDHKEEIERAIELNSPGSLNVNAIEMMEQVGNLNLKNLIGNRRLKASVDKSTNFENMLDMIGQLKSYINLEDTIDDLDNAEIDRQEGFVYGTKKGRLQESCRILKQINFPGCFGVNQRKLKNVVGNENRMIGSNVQNAFNATGLGNGEAAAELIAALCFDQVMGATKFVKSLLDIDNILEDGRKFETIEELFSKTLFDFDTIPSLMKRHEFYFRTRKQKGGSIVKHLFEEKQSPYDEKTYIPYETNNTISEKLYEENNYFPGEEIYFTSALKNNDTSFEELENFITKFKTKWEDFSTHLIKSVGLDFDYTGKASSPDLNTIDQLNPMSYLNYYLNLLADDLEATYMHENVERRKKGLVSLAMFLNNASSLSRTVSSYKSVLMNTLLSTSGAELWQNEDETLWIFKEDETLSDKGEGLVATLYTEAEAQTEKSFVKILEGLGIDDYPKSTRQHPDGRGNYNITLTASGLNPEEGGIGTLVPDSKILLGDTDNYVAGEDDSTFKRYSYGQTGPLGGTIDNELMTALNLVDREDWKGPLTAIAVGIAVFGVSLIPGVGPAIAAGLSKIGLSGLTVGYWTTAVGGAATYVASGITIGGSAILGGVVGGSAYGAYVITSAVTEESYESANPVGVTLTGSSNYTLATITNQPVQINVEDKENLPMPNIMPETVSHFNSYFFKNRPGESRSTGFLEIEHPGEFGHVKNFSAVHRSFLMHYFAVKLLQNTQRLKVYINTEKKFKISIKITRMKGLINALRGNQLSSGAVRSEVRAHNETNRLINQIKRKIRKRQDYILGIIGAVNKKIYELEIQHKRLKSFITTADGRSPLLREKLEANNFFEETVTLLNPSYVDYLSKSYHQNFVLSPTFDDSTFALYDKDVLSDLKIMYRVLSAKNYGFLEKEKFGRKNVFHVGIPLGLLDFLRRRTFRETGDRDYLDSSLIKITVYKNNQINSELHYIPKQFVFDLSKHILPFNYDQTGKAVFSNHIENATDDKTLEKIINDMEIFKYNDMLNFGFKSNGFGLSGITGNRKSSKSNNYDENFKKEVLLNHIFDYYLKLYTRLSCNIDLNESSFLINSDNIFSGESDNRIASEFKSSIYRKFLRDYPEVDTNPAEKEYFSRSINMINNSLLMSSNNRLKEMMTANCFERVFSVFINEKDFLIDSDNSSTYSSQTQFGYTGQLQQGTVNYTNGTSLQGEENTFASEVFNEKETTMSGFSVEIEMLKKW